MDEELVYEGGGKFGDAFNKIKDKVSSKFGKKGAPAGKGTPGAPGADSVGPGAGDGDPGASSGPVSVGDKTGVGNIIVSGMNKAWAFLTTARGAIISVFAFFLMIYIILWILSDDGKKNNNSRSYMYKNTGYEDPWYIKMYKRATGFRNPLGVKAYGGVAREELTSGRCDNKVWIPYKSGNNAICVNTGFARPRPVRFIIRPENLYEYDQLPYKVKDLIRKNANKLYITVPYKYIEQPSSYVLDFTQAKFQDGKPAAKLFNNFNYDSWSFKTLTVPQYTNRQRYDSRDTKKYKGLDSFVPIPKPKKKNRNTKNKAKR